MHEMPVETNDFLRGRPPRCELVVEATAVPPFPDLQAVNHRTRRPHVQLAALRGEAGIGKVEVPHLPHANRPHPVQIVTHHHLAGQTVGQHQRVFRPEVRTKYRPEIQALRRRFHHRLAIRYRKLAQVCLVHLHILRRVGFLEKRFADVMHHVVALRRRHPLLLRHRPVTEGDRFEETVRIRLVLQRIHRERARALHRRRAAIHPVAGEADFLIEFPPALERRIVAAADQPGMVNIGDFRENHRGAPHPPPPARMPTTPLSSISRTWMPIPRRLVCPFT